MNDLAAQAEAIRRRTLVESAAVGLRLAESIAARFGIPLQTARRQWLGSSQKRNAPLAEALNPALGFALEFAQDCGLDMEAPEFWQTKIAAWREADNSHPLWRIAQAAGTGGESLFLDLLLLACLPELHEGYAALCRLLHPEGVPYPTVALALHWLEYELRADDAPPMEAMEQVMALRGQVEELLLHSPTATWGLLRLEGSGPWHGRTLKPGPGMWEALNARIPRLPNLELLPGFLNVPGLETWLTQPETQRAMCALSSGLPCLVALLGENETMRTTRARALLGAASVTAVRTRLRPEWSAQERSSALIDAYCLGFTYRVCPWLEILGDPGEASNEPLLELPRGLVWEMPVLVSAGAEAALPDFGLPILSLRVETLLAPARRMMWKELLPQLADSAGILAARYRIDPNEAKGIVGDLALRQQAGGTPPQPLDFDDISDCLRSRTAWRTRPGVRRVIPHAQWRDLLIPQHAQAQLDEAVLRIHRQLMVLDDWGFEQGHTDRRGLRLLFYGPPGTGKTLAAEAMAKALGIDLLAVDISSLVSKWIGETEKNLAGVFNLAESSRALLLFDEADALFGRRADVSDASDRYANLETAFLLQRLERYEGVTILATNLRASIDAAFMRRFEFIVEFPEPDLPTRERLWRLHLPAEAPLGVDVDLHELANWYAISGAQIRNAALGAAFLAAAEPCAGGPKIRQEHFLRAIEREFEKAGKAHPGNPPGRMSGAGQVHQNAVEAGDVLGSFATL